LDEPAGSTFFYDLSGMENHAFCSSDSCPQAGVPGMICTALISDGIDDFIQVKPFQLGGALSFHYGFMQAM